MILIVWIEFKSSLEYEMIKLAKITSFIFHPRLRDRSWCHPKTSRYHRCVFLDRIKYTHLINPGDDVGGHIVKAFLHLFEHVLHELVKFFGAGVFWQLLVLHYLYNYQFKSSNQGLKDQPFLAKLFRIKCKVVITHCLGFHLYSVCFSTS